MSSATRTILLTQKKTKTGTGTTDWILLNKNGGEVLMLQVEASATSTVSIEGTANEALLTEGGTVPAAEINTLTDMNGTDLVALVANGLHPLQGPLKAVRINQTAGVGSSGLTVLQSERV